MRKALALSGVIIFGLLGSRSQSIASTCGPWERVDRSGQFAAEPAGTLALVQDSRYLIFGREKCVNLSRFGELYFQINHNGASTTQPTFVSIHVALIKIGGRSADQQHLFRSSGAWNKDRTGIPYNSDHQSQHNAFNQALAGDQAQFNKSYVDDVGRTWNDSVDTTTSPPLRFESWSYRGTFSLRSELTDALQRGAVSVASQNYLISFTSRAKTETRTDLGSPPDFTVRASGYDCAIIRISGTSILPELTGEYMINQNQNGACNSLISGFDANTLWSVLLGQR